MLQWGIPVNEKAQWPQKTMKRQLTSMMASFASSSKSEGQRENAMNTWLYVALHKSWQNQLLIYDMRKQKDPLLPVSWTGDTWNLLK